MARKKIHQLTAVEAALMEDMLAGWRGTPESGVTVKITLAQIAALFQVDPEDIAGFLRYDTDEQDLNAIERDNARRNIGISTNAHNAAEGANAPSQDNPFATMDDLEEGMEVVEKTSELENDGEDGEHPFVDFRQIYSLGTLLVSGSGTLNNVAIAADQYALDFSAEVETVTGIAQAGESQRLIFVTSQNPAGLILPAEDEGSLEVNRVLTPLRVPYRVWVPLIYRSGINRWMQVLGPMPDGISLHPDSPEPVRKVWYGTQEEFDELETVDPDTEYNIEGTPLSEIPENVITLHEDSPEEVKKVWYGTQEEFDELETVDPDTEYNIEGTPITFGTTAGTATEGNDSRVVNGQTAFSWGNHASAGYAVSGTAAGQVRTNTQLDARYAPVSHDHVAGDITSGTFAIARIPTGTSGSTVAIGNDSRIVNGQTAFSWGNHGGAGYAVSGTAGGQIRTNTQLDARYLQLAGEQIITGEKWIRRAGTSGGSGAPATVLGFEIGSDSLYKLQLNNRQNEGAGDAECQWSFVYTSNAGSGTAKARDMIGFARNAVTILGGRAIPESLYGTLTTLEGNNSGTPSYRVPLRQYAYATTQLERAIIGVENRITDMTGTTRLYLDGNMIIGAPASTYRIIGAGGVGNASAHISFPNHAAYNIYNSRSGQGHYFQSNGDRLASITASGISTVIPGGSPGALGDLWRLGAVSTDSSNTVNRIVRVQIGPTQYDLLARIVT